MKKFFVATIISLTVFIATQFNVCNAMIEPDRIYLGGITYGSSIEDMIYFHGEPDAYFNGVEGYATCEYADSATVTYQKSSGQIKSIVVTAESPKWAADEGITVGMYFDEWLKCHASPEVVKKGDLKTVYLYFHYQSNPVLHETFRNYGLFIVFDNKSGKITELRIYGDTDFATFEESFDSVMTEMIN